MKQRNPDKKRSKRSTARERGSALIELALIVLPLVVIAMGMVEYGLTWRDKDNVQNASRAGARTAANLANNDQTDREALLAILASLNPDEADEITYIVFYQLDASGNAHVNCVSSDLTPPPGEPGQCNVYTPAALATLADPAQWGCDGGCWDDAWTPIDRDPQFHTPIDLGVYIQSHRDWVTGMFPGDGIDFGGESVFRLNPLNR